MNARAPYALEAWYPAVRAPVRAMRVLDAEDGTRAGDVDAAWAGLAPGEALVIVHRARGRKLRGLGRRTRVDRLAERLRGAGRIDRWFVLPGTGGSHVLLPPARAAFAAGARLLPAGRRAWRAARRLLVGLARLGLAGRLGLDEVVVAVRGPAGPPRVPWIAEQASPEVSIALGVPGSLRKAVVLVSGPGGDVRGLLKLSLTSAAREQVRREARVLEELSRSRETPIAPAVHAHGRTEELAWLAMSVLEGRRSPDVPGDVHFSFLADLHASSATRADLETLEVFRAACRSVAALGDAADPEWHAEMAGLRDALRLRLDGASIPCCRCHGDFAPWNLLVTGSGLAAFDWEFSLSRAPVLFDLFHFHFQTGVLVRHVGARRLLDELDALVAGPARELREAVGVTPAQIAGLAGIYVLHAAALDAELERIERPPFAQVEWLRRTRIELAHLLAARLQSHRATSRAALVA